MTGTHVSYDGYLQKIIAILSAPLPGAEFISYGRLVNPRGNYTNAPHVALYRTTDGFIAVY